MHKKDNWLFPCPLVWGELYIYWNGKVGTCCDDNDRRRLIIGDANKQTLQEIYMGKEIENLRKIHLTGGRLSHGICGKCYHNYPWT